MVTVILSLLVLIYFIRGQFGFERPTRWRYWLIPVFAAVMFVITFKMSMVNVMTAVMMILIGVVIGVYQGHFAIIRSVNVGTDAAHVEVRGGLQYLIGWLLILVIQLAAEVVFKHEYLAWSAISKEAFQSVLEELFPFQRLHGGGWWVLWALSASASLGYTLTLVRRSALFRTTIKRRARRNRRRANQKRKW